MCECHHRPHDPVCPDAPDPQPLFECEDCGYGIIAGEVYYNFEFFGRLCTLCGQTVIDNAMRIAED